MSLKNKWRKRGALEFRRETKRLHDGTPDGDVLFIRIKRQACVFVTHNESVLTGKKELWGYDGLYFKPRNAVDAGKRCRRALMEKVMVSA